jgi:hypothetical protein
LPKQGPSQGGRSSPFAMARCTRRRRRWTTFSSGPSVAARGPRRTARMPKLHWENPISNRCNPSTARATVPCLVR